MEQTGDGHDTGNTFVMIERLESLQNLQDVIKQEVQSLREEFLQIKEYGLMVERVVQYQNQLWAAIISFMMFVAPVLLCLASSLQLLPHSTTDGGAYFLISIATVFFLPYYIYSLLDCAAAKTDLNEHLQQLRPAIVSEHEDGDEDDEDDYTDDDDVFYDDLKDGDDGNHDNSEVSQCSESGVSSEQSVAVEE